MTKSAKIIITASVLLALGAVAIFIFKKPKEEEEEENEYENENDSNSSSSSVPFKNKAEGNAFRNWVNDVFPAYAVLIFLDRSGSHNNSFISKAWKKHGVYYTDQKDNPLKFVASFSGRSVSGNKVVVKTDRGTGTFYDNGKFEISYLDVYSPKKMAGVYSNGGRILHFPLMTGGKNAGKTFKNNSVLTNINDAIK
jgi:hypothetical protein